MTTVPLLRTKWFLPAFTGALGLVFGAAFWAGGDRGSAVFAVALMGAVGLGILLGGRSDLVRGLRGDGRDEYWERSTSTRRPSRGSC